MYKNMSVLSGGVNGLQSHMGRTHRLAFQIHREFDD